MNESGISLFEAETYEDLIGKNVYDQLHPCDHDGVKQRIQNIINRKTESEIIKQSWFTFKNLADLHGNGLHSDDVFRRNGRAGHSA